MRAKYPQRKRLRRSGFDYAKPGPYMITVCMRHRMKLLSRIENREANLTSVGDMCFRWWVLLESKFPGLQLKEVIFMPDHMHGILWLDGSVSLFNVMQWYKTMTTNEYIRGVKEHGWPPFDRKLWLRSYWEDHLHSERYLHNAEAYIKRNPEKG
jgi:REP element-mobilizing transposase RayT